MPQEMPATQEDTLGDFFTKKPVKKKKKQDGTAKDQSESTPQVESVVESEIATTNATSVEQEESNLKEISHAPKQAESSVEVPTRTFDEEVAEKMPMEESFENAQGNEVKQDEYPIPNELEKRLDPEDESIYTFAKLVEKNKASFEFREIVAYWHKDMYPIPSEFEKRLDPEDEIIYTFAKLLEKSKGSFAFMEIVAYWFDVMDPVAKEEGVDGEEVEVAAEVEVEELASESGIQARALPPLAVSATSGPRLDFVLNTRDGVQIYGMVPGSDNPELVASFQAVEAADGLKWSPDGRMLGLRGSQSLQILNAENGYKSLCQLQLQGTDWTSGFKFYFSPKASYAVCFEPSDRSDTVSDHENNLRVWHLSEKPVLAGTFFHDRRSEAVWPVLKWTPDEKLCCRIAKDELQVFPGNRLKKANTIIPCEGVTAFEVSENHVALFVPQRKQAKARAFVYSFKDPNVPTASHELGQGSNVDIWWNHIGTAVLFLVSTDVDDTGESYYGKTTLFLVCADGSACHEVVPESGDIHDVAWRPNQDEFLLLHGNLPCKITIHNGWTAEQALYLGTARRNKIQWSPLGSFFILGGFGNLIGDIDFWDRLSNQKMGKNRYECCVDCRWSADGRYVLGCTTSPRMRVDNRIEIFDYVGNQIYVLKSKELYDASWRPMPDVFEDRPRSPGRVCNAPAHAEKDSTKAMPYVPRKSDGQFAALLRAYDEEDALTKAMTSEEQEAERLKQQAAKEAEQEAERMKQQAAKEAEEEKKREKQERDAAFQEAISKPAKDKKYRSVDVPYDLIRRIIGAKGASIAELQELCGLKMEVRTHKGEKGESTATVTIGPAHSVSPEDELDRAQEQLLNKIEEYRQEEQAIIDGKGGKGGGKKGKKGTKEIIVDAELMGGIIGWKGATIEELKTKAGIYMKVVANPNDDSGAGKVLIGPDDPQAMERAEEIVRAKLEELRAVKYGTAKGKRKDGKGKGDMDDRWGEPKESGKSKGKDGSKRKGDKGDDWSDRGGKGKKGKDGWKGAEYETSKVNRVEPYEPLKDEDFGPTLGEAFGKTKGKPVVNESVGASWGVTAKSPDVSEESQVKKQWMGDSIVKGKWADQEDDPTDVFVPPVWTKNKGKGRGDQADEENREAKTGRERGNDRNAGVDRGWGAEHDGHDSKSRSGYDRGSRSEQTWGAEDSNQDAKSRGGDRGYGKGSGSDRGWGAENDYRDTKSRGGDRSGYEKNSRVDDNRDSRSRGGDKGGYEKSHRSERWGGEDDNRATTGRGGGGGGGRGGYEKSGGWNADDDTRDTRSRGNERSGYDKDRSWNDKSNGWNEKSNWYQDEPVPKGQRHKSGSSRKEVVESSQREPASASTSARATPSESTDKHRLKDSARAAFQNGDFKAALDMYTKCLREDPRDAHILVERSKCYLKLDDSFKACFDCNSACVLSPDWREAWVQKSICQKANGRHEEAEISWTKAEKLKASQPPGSSENENSRQHHGAQEADETGDDRVYSCGDCGDAAARGAIDPSNGVWYCQACWEALEPAHPPAESTKAPKQSERQRQSERPQQRSAPERHQGSRDGELRGQREQKGGKGNQRQQGSDRRQGNERKPPSDSHRPQQSDRHEASRPQQSDRHEASTSEPPRTMTMPKNPFGAAQPRKTPS